MQQTHANISPSLPPPFIHSLSLSPPCLLAPPHSLLSLTLLAPHSLPSFTPPYITLPNLLSLSPPSLIAPLHLLSLTPLAFFLLSPCKWKTKMPNALLSRPSPSSKTSENKHVNYLISTESQKPHSNCNQNQ